VQALQERLLLLHLTPPARTLAGQGEQSRLPGLDLHDPRFLPLDHTLQAIFDPRDLVLFGLDLRRERGAVFGRQGRGFKYRLLLGLRFLSSGEQTIGLLLNIRDAAKAGHVREALGLAIGGGIHAIAPDFSG
jgi:hypothetical protein